MPAPQGNNVLLLGIGLTVCVVLSLMDINRGKSEAGSVAKEIPKLKSVGVLPTLRIAYW